MQNWRLDHPLKGQDRARINAAALVNAYIRKGRIRPLCCELCGSLNSTFHHADFSKPFAIRWLCRQCRSKLLSATMIRKHRSDDL
jgi:hypothetical protein